MKHSRLFVFCGKSEYMLIRDKAAYNFKEAYYDTFGLIGSEPLLSIKRHET